MGKPNLFDDDDGDDQKPSSSFKINEAYAERYDNWRRLEEMQKMKDKYGNDIGEEEESSSESEPEWTADDEKDFLRTLGALKSNNSTIYDSKRTFFKVEVVAISLTVSFRRNWTPRRTRRKKEKPKAKDEKLYLRDYERKVVLEKEGKLDDEDDEIDDDAPKPEGYYEEQERIKRELKKALSAADGGEDGDLLVKREKSKGQKEEEDADFYEWLKKQEDEPIEGAEDLVPLKKAWNDPNIDAQDRFLRDYLLNKDYECGDDEAIPTYDQICDVANDEEELERQEQYETKYNFRFEEPDQEFIKQYPRTVAESIRKKDTARKDQRETIRERKKQEKDEKKKEIAEMKRMKKDEINKKLAKLRRLAGDDVPLSVDDLEGDFDPAEYDRRMKEVFDQHYYDNEEAIDNVEGLEKPVFSDMSDDEFDGDESDDPDNVQLGTLKQKPGPANPDVEGDEQEEEEESKFRGRMDASGRRKKRNSQFAEAVSRAKPLWNPKEKTFEEYFNEYYALDYEDILGDQRTRFHYRQVIANDFGLQVDEILDADDRQLNAWASVKKATAYRTDAEEKFDVNAYRRKAQDTQKKARLFATDFGGKKTKKLEETEQKVDVELQERVDVDDARKNNGAAGQAKTDAAKKSKTKKKKTEKSAQEAAGNDGIVEAKEKTKAPKTALKATNGAASTENDTKKKRTRKRKGAAPADALQIDDQRLAAYGLNPKKFKNKLRYGKKPRVEAGDAAEAAE
ncbi:unnamed protein product, partial [Mesorhabditis spiculigera]